MHRCFLPALAALIAVLCLPSLAWASDCFPGTGGRAIGQCYPTQVIIDPSTGQPAASGGGGGGGGGAATIANGADTAEGSTTDNPWGGTGAGTTIALLKALYAQQAAALPAGSNLIGSVGIQAGGGGVAAGSGASNTNTLRVITSSDSTVAVSGPLGAGQDGSAVGAILQDGKFVVGTNSAGTVTPVAASATGVVGSSFDTAGYQSVNVQMSGTFSVFLTYQEANDNTNFNAVAARNNASLGTSADATSLNAAGVYCFPIGGRFGRVNLTTYSSGTVNVVAVLRQNPCPPRAVFANQGGANSSPWPIVEMGSASSAYGITSAVSGSASSGVVIKASAGNLYSVSATCTAACWLMIFNATTIPADGATTAGVASGNLQECIPIASGGTGGVNFGAGPGEVFTAGISAAISSTACATKTASTVGFINGRAR